MSEIITGRNAIFATAAFVAVGAAAVGISKCGTDSEGGSPDGSEFVLDQAELGAYCGDTDVLALDQYKAAIGENATFPIESFDANNVHAIRAEVSSEIAKNAVGLATAKILIEYGRGDANFSDLQERIQTTLAVITSDEEKFEEACGVVISAFMTEGERVNIEGSQYVEVSPVYVGENLDTSRVEFKNPNPNATSVSGFWIKTEPGELPVAITPEGRILISKTLGNETGDSSFDPNAEPQTYVDAEGNEITVKMLPDGKQLVTKTTPDGETTTEIGPAGGSGQPNGTGPNGSGPQCGAPGQPGCEGPAGGHTPVIPVGPGGPGGPPTTTGEGSPTTTTTVPPPPPPPPTTTTTSPPPPPPPPPPPTTTTTLPPKNEPKPLPPPPPGF